MPSLCDVNFLVPVCYDHHVFHAGALRWLASNSRAGEFVVCRASQLGLLRLLNNPAAMREDVLTVDEAWRVFDALMRDDRFAFAVEPPGLEAALRRLMRGAAFSPKRWQDAYLAAFAVAGRLSLVTFDAAFRQFDGLDVALLKP